MGTNLPATLAPPQEAAAFLPLEGADREILRCAACDLLQYRTRSGLCRRCNAGLDAPPPPPPAPEPVAVAAAGVAVPDVAAAIRFWRHQHGWSQRQLAERMNVPRTYVSKIENEKAMPTISSLARMAAAMDTNVATLLQCTGGGSEAEMQALLHDGFIRSLAPLVPSLQPAHLRRLLEELRRRVGS